MDAGRGGHVRGVLLNSGSSEAGLNWGKRDCPSRIVETSAVDEAPTALRGGAKERTVNLDVVINHLAGCNCEVLRGHECRGLHLNPIFTIN